VRRQIKLPLKPSEHRGLLIIVDLGLVLVAVLCALVVWALKDDRVLRVPFVLSQRHWFPLLGSLWLLLALLNDFYSLRVAADPRASASALLRITGLELVAYLLVYFLSPPNRPLPRGIVLYHAGASFALIGVWRAVYRFLSRAALGRRVIVVGAGWAGRTLVQAIRENEGAGLELVGFVDDDPDKQGQTVEGLPVIGDREDLVSLVEAEGVSQVVLAITHDLPEGLFRALLDCSEQGVEITPMPLVYEEITGRVPVQHVGDNWLVALPMDHASAGGLFPVFKRGLDVFVSLTGLVILAPLFPLIALALYVDSPGPVFYLQERVGRGGRIYRLIKLRTMVPHAEKDGRAVWAAERDPRVTRFGRLLRATHIDELPQFINVLKGDMSVVGPRPERPEFVAELERQVPFYRLRHAVRPGMAGWGLVNYGYGSSVEDALVKVQYDLYYIKRQSLALDLLILLQTFRRMALFQGSQSRRHGEGGGTTR
jgi:exopolysaccharide biosynthesis polyprenyl glycosylphosphotransferase